MKCSVNVISQANNARELVHLCSTAASSGMLNRTRYLYHTYMCVRVHSCFSHCFSKLSTVGSIPLLLSHHPDVLPDELFSDPWVPLDVSPSTRSEVAEVSRSGNCSTSVSWELSLALRRWAFHTSWAAQTFGAPSDPLVVATSWHYLVFRIHHIVDWASTERICKP